jgi:hypothetical protein
MVSKAAGPRVGFEQAMDSFGLEPGALGETFCGAADRHSTNRAEIKRPAEGAPAEVAEL